MHVIINPNSVFRNASFVMDEQLVGGNLGEVVIGGSYWRGEKGREGEGRLEKGGWWGGGGITRIR